MAKKEKTEELTFTKSQILSAERFRGRRDLLTALMDDSKTYTIPAVEELIENFMKGTVN